MAIRRDFLIMHGNSKCELVALLGEVRRRAVGTPLPAARTAQRRFLWRYVRCDVEALLEGERCLDLLIRALVL